MKINFYNKLLMSFFVLLIVLLFTIIYFNNKLKADITKTEVELKTNKDIIINDTDIKNISNFNSRLSLIDENLISEFHKSDKLSVLSLSNFNNVRAKVVDFDGILLISTLEANDITSISSYIAYLKKLPQISSIEMSSMFLVEQANTYSFTIKIKFNNV